MSPPDTRVWTAKGPSETRSTVRRVFAEFLTIPTWIVAGFLLLAAGGKSRYHEPQSLREQVREY